MPQFASYPLTTTLAPDDLLLIHQDASGVEKTVKYADLVSSSYVINVKAYGAVGDGITDDSAAVQAAFNAAITGSVVLFPSSASGYIINTPITVPIGNITVVGYGAVLSNTADSQYRKFIVTGPNWFIRFEGLSFSGNYSSMAPVTTNGTIAITNASQITVNNCQFISTNAAGVYIAGDSRDISVTNCKFFRTYAGVVTAVSGGNNPSNLKVNGNFFRTGLGNTSAANSGGIIMAGTAPAGFGIGSEVSDNDIISYGKYGIYLNTAIHNSVVANNFISGAGIGIQVDASTGVVVSGNTLRDVVNEGILIQSSSDNVNVSGNVLNVTDSNANGIKLSNIVRGTVSGNNVESAGDGLVILNCSSPTITGNTFRSTGENVVLIGGSLIVGGVATISNFVLSGNNIIAAGAGTRYHIKLDSSSSLINNGLITSNFFSGSVLDAGVNLYAPGANSIADINITANNTNNAVSGSGKFLDFGGTVNPTTVLNRIWTSGNLGIPGAVDRNLNMDYVTVSSSLSMPYVWFIYQNGTIAVDASGGARSIELPKLNDYSGWKTTIIKSDSSTNEVTITGFGGGENINGQSSYVLRNKNESVTLVSGGNEWRIESKVLHSVTTVYSGVNVTVANSPSEKTIDWGNVIQNTANAWSNVQLSRLYIPTGAKSVRLTMNFRWAENAAGNFRAIKITSDDGKVWATNVVYPTSGVAGAFGPAGTIQTPIIPVSTLPSGSSAYFYVKASQNSGGDLDLFGNIDHTNFQIEVIE